jgi:hypothetical protein
MPEFLKVYGPALGPLGFPMSDRQAFALNARLKGLPAEFRQERKAVTLESVAKLSFGGRDNGPNFARRLPRLGVLVTVAKL